MKKTNLEKGRGLRSGRLREGIFDSRLEQRRGGGETVSSEGGGDAKGGCEDGEIISNCGMV